MPIAPCSEVVIPFAGELTDEMFARAKAGLRGAGYAIADNAWFHVERHLCRDDDGEEHEGFPTLHFKVGP